ncbi:RHS repeat-associated core domain-containing protein [Streptomyces niveiscabiei]
MNFVRSVNPMDPYDLTHPAEYATSLNSLAAGLLVAANDPVGTGKQMVDGFMKDPTEGFGRLLPDVALTLATGGGGAAVKGVRVAEEASDLAKARRLLDETPEGTHTRPDVERHTDGTDPVDLATGRMYLPQTDVEIPGILPLLFTRRTESGCTAGRFLGPSWTSTVDERLTIDAIGVVHITADGLLIPYPHPAPGAPTTPETGRTRTLLSRGPDGDYTLTDPDTGLTFHFTAPPGSEPGGDGTAFAYDDRRRVTAWTDSNASRYDYVYDDRVVAEGGQAGHVQITLATTDPLGHTTRFTHDPRGNLLTRTDPLGRTTSFSYDEDGRLTTVTRPDSTELRVVRGPFGLPVERHDPDGARWLQEFDAHGNRTAVTDPAGRTTHYAYDESGLLTSVTDALGATTLVRCDGSGRPVDVTDPAGGTTRLTRDALGRPVRVSDPTGGVTHLEWHADGQLARRTGPDGATESWTYDGEGNCLTHTDAAGGVSRFEYPHFDLLAARIRPDGARYEFEHDAGPRLTRVTDPQGLTWTYEYDAAGNTVSETDFDGRLVTYGLDAAGQLATRTDHLGAVTAYAYDELGRLIRKEVADRVTVHAYDRAGRLIQASSPDSELVRGYDRCGRLKTELVDGRALDHAYDAVGRRIRRTTPTGLVTSYAYDAAGRPTRVSTGGHDITFTHDPAGREAERVFGDIVTQTSAWDEAGRLSAQHLTAGSRTLNERTYAYRAGGRLTATSDRLSGKRTFELDPVGRVTAVHAHGWSERYAYDASGNQTTAAWPAAHPGHEATGPRTYTGTAVTRAGDIRFEHDALGRVTLRQKIRLSRKPDTWRYTGDAEDRLTSVVTPDGTRWRYRYDPLGRRTAKQRLTQDGDTVAEEIRFTWDGPTLCEQTSVSGDLPRPVAITWEHRGLVPLAQTERILTPDARQEEIDRRFFAVATDLIGTPTELIDESGQIAWRTRTTLWGTTAWSRSSTAYTPLRFPGQYYDPETGLHHNLFRHYDPETGRYTSPDPLGLSPAPNPVAYVTNPHTVCDPFGLSPYPNGEGPTIGEYTTKGEGQDLKHSATVGDDQWHFNTGHGYDRAHTGPDGTTDDLRTTNLKPDQIEQAIVSDVYAYMRDGGVVPRARTPEFTGPLDRSIQIDGHDIGYRVIQRPDGAYQLSTYWLNP